MSRASSDDAAAAEISPAVQRVQVLLAGISSEALAQTAYRCGAHARALQYFETHLRSRGKRTGRNPAAYQVDIFDDVEVSFLQVRPNTAHLCTILGKLDVF